MTDNILPILVGGLLALLGVLVSNVYSWFLQKDKLENERKKDVQKERKANGEELFTLFSKQVVAIRSQHMTLKRVMQGGLTYNQHLDLFIENTKSEPVEGSRIELLCQAYFPSLRDLYEDVQKSYAASNSVIERHKTSYISNGSGQEFLPELEQVDSELFNSSKKFKEALILELQRQP